MHTHALFLASAAPVVSPSPAGTAAPAGQNAAASSIIPNISVSWASYFEALAVLCFLLAALWALLWFLKKRGGGSIFASPAPAMRIESRLALGPKKWLYIVRCLEKRLVLGVSDKSISLISESPLSQDEILADSNRGLFGRKAAGTIKAKERPSADDPPENRPAREPEEASAFAAFLKEDPGSGRL